MKHAYVFNIVGGIVDGYNPHGGGVCLRYLQYLTYLSSSKNNWYRHTPPTPRARPQRLGKNIAANVGNLDKSATSKGFSRLDLPTISSKLHLTQTEKTNQIKPFYSEARND